MKQHSQSCSSVVQLKYCAFYHLSLKIQIFSPLKPSRFKRIVSAKVRLEKVCLAQTRESVQLYLSMFLSSNQKSHDHAPKERKYRQYISIRPFIQDFKSLSSKKRIAQLAAVFVQITDSVFLNTLLYKFIYDFGN